VHNSLASQVAIELKLTGLNLTPVQREISFETALWHGARELALDRADLALAGAADELNQYPLAAGMRWGWWREAMSEIRPFTAELPAGQRPLPGEGCAVFALGRDGGGAQPLARVSGIRIGRVARAAGGWMDVSREAEWILETLERAGVRLSEVDLFLTGANGWPQLDRLYLEVAEGLSRLAGRSIPCGAYKQCSGEYHAASAFGFFTAMALVRGDISPGLCVRGDDAPPPLDCPCRRIILYTLSSAGTKGMCCVHA
jgi:3-oxoacyl-(acyl-carrier-protein) synthase